MGDKEIEYAIMDILIEDGPDGHADGSDVITDFVINLINGKGEEWIKNYREVKNIED